MYMCIYLCIHASAYKYVVAGEYVYVHIFIHTCISIQVCCCRRICICAYIYIYMHQHTSMLLQAKYWQNKLAPTQLSTYTYIQICFRVLHILQHSKTLRNTLKLTIKYVLLFYIYCNTPKHSATLWNLRSQRKKMFDCSVIVLHIHIFKYVFVHMYLCICVYIYIYVHRKKNWICFCAYIYQHM